MDESGVQLNNKLENVVATKEAKQIQQITSSKKQKAVFVVACNNEEGPPVLITEEVNRNDLFYFLNG